MLRGKDGVYVVRRHKKNVKRPRQRGDSIEAGQDRTGKRSALADVFWGEKGVTLEDELLGLLDHHAVDVHHLQPDLAHVGFGVCVSKSGVHVTWSWVLGQLCVLPGAVRSAWQSQGCTGKNYVP
eukprot:516469-Rhodomonas_salina.1